MEIISLVCQKGGVGKTTSAQNIAAYLKRQGHRVLAIDLDPQGNLTTASGVNKHDLTLSSNELLLEDDIKASECIIRTEGYDIIPSDIMLSGAEMELISMFARESILKNKLIELEDEYDYIIIDLPPSLSLLTVNGLIASSGVLIPVSSDPFALDGLDQLINTVKKIKRLNTKLEIKGIFITKFTDRTKIGKEIEGKLIEKYGDLILKSKIRVNVALTEAQHRGVDIFRHKLSSNAAIDYTVLGEEVFIGEQ